MDTSLLRRTPVSSPVVLGDFEGNLRRWRYMSSLSRNSSSVSSKPPLLTRVAGSGPETRLEEPVRTYIRSQIKVAFDWEIRISDFEIELEIRVIRKRISPTRNPFSGWISIRKSKCGFHRLPFYRSIGKSEKGFAKLLSWTTVFFLLIVRVRARPLPLRTVFQINFFGFPNRTVKTQIQKRISSKSIFRFRVRLQIRNADFKL